MYLCLSSPQKRVTYPLHKKQNVLILSTKAVDHVNDMGNTCMMEPEPAFLSPLV